MEANYSDNISDPYLWQFLKSYFGTKEVGRIKGEKKKTIWR